MARRQDAVAAPRYRGEDRRVAAPGPITGRSWLGAGIVLLGVLAVLGLRSFDPEVVTSTGPLIVQLRVAALALAGVVVAASVRLWHATGEARAVHGATLGWLLTLVLLARLLVPGTVAGVTLAAALTAAATIPVWRAAWGPAVDTGSSHVREVAITLGAALAVWVSLLTVVPWALPPGTDLAPVLHLLLAAAWAVTAGGALLRVLHAGSHLLGWLAWSAVAVGLAEGARTVALLHPGRGFTFVGVALITSAMVLAATGAVAGLARAATAGRTRLHHVVEDGRRREAARRSAFEEQTHELRGALLAIEGATLTLQRHRADLPEELRTELTAAVVDQIAQLRDLLDPHPDTAPLADPPAPPRFRPADVAREQAALGRARGLQVELTALAPVEVEGSAATFARILSNLLRNAEHHGVGPAGQVRVQVRVEQHDAGIRIAVHDDGPGVPQEHLETIFGRGTRLRPDRGGEGLGLHIARAAARELGGDLTLEPGTAGGACFVTILPLAVRSPATTRDVVSA